MFSERYNHDDFPHKISLERNYTFRVFFEFYFILFLLLLLFEVFVVVLFEGGGAFETRSQWITSFARAIVSCKTKKQKNTPTKKTQKRNVKTEKKTCNFNLSVFFYFTCKYSLCSYFNLL